MLGGSFDPVHLGHMALAHSALAQLPVDELWWVPVGQPWQKSRTPSSAEDRVAMLQLAIGRDERQRVELCEIARGGPTYTIDTLEELSTRHPGVRWYLLLGWDQFLNLPTWNRWQDVVARVKLAVAQRPGQGSALVPDVLKGLPIERLHMAPWDVSSTAIRTDAAGGRVILDRVSAPVARYIAEHGLYRAAQPL